MRVLVNSTYIMHFLTTLPTMVIPLISITNDSNTPATLFFPSNTSYCTLCKCTVGEFGELI